MGLPVLTMELAGPRVRRRARKQGAGARGSKWHIHGWFCMVGCILLMMYYTTVSGWMLDYFFRFLTGNFDGLTSEQASGIFGEMLSSPVEMVFWMVIITLAGFVVSGAAARRPGKGRQMDDERTARSHPRLGRPQLCPVRCGRGLAFYLLPDWSRASEQGLGNVITAAMNQSFLP